MSERATVRKLVDGIELAGAVDPNGQIKVPLQYRWLSYWVNGLALARESNQDGAKQALVDSNGNILGGRYFDKVDRAEVGDVSKVLIDGNWVGIDRAGKIIDASGQPTTPYLFEQHNRRSTCDKPSSVRLNGLWGFVGVNGRLLFDPPAFKNQFDFEGEYAAVSDGRNWGMIDTSGRFVLPMKFDKYIGRRDGLFHFATEGREVWLTATGEERPEPPIKSASPQLLDCGQGLRLVERDGLWGIVDADGNQVIAPCYRAVDCFKQGVAWVAIDSRRQWCPVDPQGALRDKPECRTSHYPYIQTHSYPEGFAQDPFENSVLWTRAHLEFGAGRREAPPRWVGDGIRGSSSVIR
jgi:WG containing repeat